MEDCYAVRFVSSCLTKNSFPMTVVISSLKKVFLPVTLVSLKIMLELAINYLNILDSKNVS